ncbi:hypothetical protein LDENG_00238990 [Lucifuga dentata]|nr:hypothetical protein LDENG_00238990 [Lucifuga dentata]
MTSSTSTRPHQHPVTTLVIGDSIIRNVKISSAIACCVPGATVHDIEVKAMEILANEPDINKVIVHVGTNDICKEQSEKGVYEHVQCFEKNWKHVYISGPIPSCGCGVGCFSRLLARHTWLLSACAAHNVAFIDNFNLFWESCQLFRADGIHPNWSGAKLLAENISFSVIHSSAQLTGNQNASTSSTHSDQSHRY